MIDLPQCKITGVFGPVSSGKTFLISRWAEQENRVVIFDATGEFIEKSNYTIIYANPKALWDLVKQTPWVFRVVYAPGRDLDTDFRYCLSALWHTQSDKLLIVDEFHEICPVSYKSEDVNTMLRFARHDKLGFVGVSQRIADVHKLFTSCCRIVVLFPTHEARDLDAIADRWGSEAADTVTSLRPLIHDDLTNMTHQIPQCLVIQKGQGARVFDFQEDRFLDGRGQAPEPIMEETCQSPVTSVDASTVDSEEVAPSESRD
jgi:hypothetical protein